MYCIALYVTTSHSAFMYDSLLQAPIVSRECPRWEPLGNAIVTNGKRVAIASDQLVVAVVQDQNVTVYRYNDSMSSWNATANPIDPQFTDDDGWFVDLSLSADGGVVAIGDYEYDSWRDRVQIFTAHPEDGWIKLGFAIEGENPGDRAGWSILLSADGTTVVIGAFLNDGNGSFSGRTRVFSYDPTNDVWNQRGGDIDGEARHKDSIIYQVAPSIG